MAGMTTKNYLILRRFLCLYVESDSWALWVLEFGLCGEIGTPDDTSELYWENFANTERCVRCGKNEVKDPTDTCGECFWTMGGHI